MEVLYIYECCPFCVRARMIFGLKKRSYEITYLLYDDEETPKKMIGQKMAPILQEGGHYMAESMDIVHKIDNKDQQPVLTGQTNPAITEWLEKVSYCNRLFMPRYVNEGLPEFATKSARDYFVAKKEAHLGSFADFMSETPKLVEQINKDLQQLSLLIKSPEACNGELSTDDIMLFPILRSLSIVEGVMYPEAVDNYRKNMSTKTEIALYSAS